MAQKFVDTSGLAISDRIVQLSDGTPVWVELPLTGNPVLRYSPDRVSSVSIASLLDGAYSICVDAADNIFLNNTLQAPQSIQAFVKGTGYSWTAGVVLGQAGGNSPQNPAVFRWANTGGGTGGAGHLVSVGPYLSGSGGLVVGAVFDAGAVLAGSSAASVSSVALASWGSGYSYAGATCSPDGFGATSGMVEFAINYSAGNQATPSFAPYSISASGAITPGTTLATSAALNPSVTLARVGSGIWLAFVTSIGSDTLAAFRLTATTLSAPVNMGLPSGVSAVDGWTMFNDPVTPLQAWALIGATPSGATQQFYRVSCSVSTGTPVWATAAVTDDELTNLQAIVRSPVTVRQPRCSLVDWAVGTYSTDEGTSLVDFDYSAFPAAPSPPSLIAPGNAQYENFAANPPFELGYESVDGFPQNAYALRIKIGGAGSYSYFNASTNAMQSTIVWNSITTAVGGTWTVTLPSGYLADGNIYNWSGASQESRENLQGAFAPDSTFTAQAGPSVAVTNPAGTVTGTTSPAVTWTGSFGAGASQTAYEVIVESGAYGTTPGSGTQAWSSGVVASTATTVSVGVALTPGVTYRVFVQLTETGSLTSPWGYSDFTLNVDLPAVAGFTATGTTDPTTGAPMVQLVVQPQDNLLSAVDASYETGTGTWVAGANTTIAQSSAAHLDGSYALSLIATAAGNVSASLPTNGYAVSPLLQYTSVMSFLAAASARTCSVAIEWYTSAGTLVSASTGASVVSSTTAWTQAFVTANAPDTAAYAVEVATVEGCATGETQYVDCAGLFPGNDATWTAGGFIGTTSVNVTFSDDGLTWYPLRGATGIAVAALEPAIVLNDYEGPLGFTRQYRAEVVSA